MSLSTHILDTARGLPAAGVEVTLEHAGPHGWQHLHTGYTDPDGRVRELQAALVPGVYRLHFSTAAYFERIGVSGLYPYVEIVFEVFTPLPGETMPHYHIPLLLTPNSYSTYRGS